MSAMTDTPFPTSNDTRKDEWKSANPDTGSAASDNSTGSTMPAPHYNSTTGEDNMVNRVARGAHDTIDRLAESAAPHVQRLQEGIGLRAEHVKQVGDEWTESLRCTVRENPLAALATAVALGVLFARLTQR